METLPCVTCVAKVPWDIVYTKEFLHYKGKIKARHPCTFLSQTDGGNTLESTLQLACGPERHLLLFFASSFPAPATEPAAI